MVCYASSLNPANLNHPSTPALFKSLIDEGCGIVGVVGKNIKN